jgi:hypothetical protein
MHNESIIKKIRKCLALSKSANVHEAATALRQARKLMECHAIDAAEIELADIGEDSVKARAVALSVWEGALARLIADTFGCATLTSTGYTLTRRFTCVKRRVFIFIPDCPLGEIERAVPFALSLSNHERPFDRLRANGFGANGQSGFIGAGASATVAKYAYDVLSRQCATARAKYIKQQPRQRKASAKTASGDAFSIGWISGARKLVEQFAANDHNRALIDRYMQQYYPNLSEAKPKNTGASPRINNSDLLHGFDAGCSARLDRGIDGVTQRTLLPDQRDQGDAR